MDNAKSQLVERLKTANSVLVTVSKDPSVDQLAACIGLTLIINKLNKHGSAVFSGQIPSTIEFLKPEETLEKTADSLRDFIIALDKNKADKLRYKVEDQMVKIFITPYKASLSEKDLEFSQGDFNVDLVIALGVKQQEELDQAIVTHGRILHDATVACLNINEQTNLGAINWQDQTASSLCELVTDLADSLGEVLDEQIATALLTGIIAETDRFSNDKTKPQTMSVSAKLMAAGANQQLVATNLEEPAVAVASPQGEKPAEPAPADDNQPVDDGTLNIKHDSDDLDISTLPAPADDNQPAEPERPSQITGSTERIMTEPPTLGGTLTANSAPEPYEPSTDPLSNMMSPASDNTNSASPSSGAQSVHPSPGFTPPPSGWSPPALTNAEAPKTPADDDGQTLTDIEESVHSPHLSVQEAEDQLAAIKAETPDDQPKPGQALNALPLGEPLHQDDQLSGQPPAVDDHNTTGLDPSLFSEVPSKNSQAPPVPPPIPDLMNNQPDSDNQIPL